jgi:hypothetical protein
MRKAHPRWEESKDQKGQALARTTSTLDANLLR